MFIKLFNIFFILNCSVALTAFAKVNTRLAKIRQAVGQIIADPVEYKNKLYYLNTKGQLFESDLNMAKQVIIFKSKQASMSAIIIDNGVAYFGDGLHENKSSFFYAYDLNKKKLLFSKTIKGHFEKKAIIYKNLVIVSAGPGGLFAFSKKTGNKVWNISKLINKKLHIDATPLLVEGNLYFTTIYKYSALISAKASTGLILWSQKLKLPIKTDLKIYNNYIIGLANDAHVYSKPNKEGELIIFSKKDGSVVKKHSVRGFNFFPFLLTGSSVYLAFSTGDVIKYNLKTFKIIYLDKIPGAISAQVFLHKKNICIASQKGHVTCYSKKNKRVFNKKYREIFTGYVSSVKEKTFVPTLQGYFSL